MLIDGEDETDYWKVVTLDYHSNNRAYSTRTLHSQAGELMNLKQEILDELDTLKSNKHPGRDGYSQKQLAGYPDETMIPRGYTHKLVSLFAISCGIIEKQLEILLSQSLIPDHKRESIVADCFEGRGLYDNLKFAEAADVIGNGIYGDATDVRKTRNNLVHDPTFRFSIDSYNTHQQKIEKCIRAPEKIHKKIEQAI